jgi:hypothetical protein
MAVAAVFDDVRTKSLGDAFDAVLGKLHGTHYPDGGREAIADRVIEFARTTDRGRSRALSACRARKAEDQIVSYRHLRPKKLKSAAPGAR